MGTPSAASTRRKPVNGTPAQTSAPEEPGTLPTDEIGVDGIGNYDGQIRAESNPALFHVEAYGRAGTTTWGEWEKIRRTDEAVSKSIDFVLAPIRDSIVSVKAAGGDKPTPLQQTQADFILWNVTEALEPGWNEVLNQTGGGAISSGFAIHEKVFAACDHPLLPNGRGYRLSKLGERLPSSLPSNPWIEDPSTGELKAIRQQGPRAGKWESLELPASKVLLHTWNRNGNNYAGFSAYRPVYYPCKIREALLKMTAVTLVREGAGIPIAYAADAKAKLTTGQRASFVKLLQNLVYHENASIVLPAGWKMDWMFSPGANKGHVVDTFNALGLLICEQVGAQQLALGTSGTGSRSVGEVHQAQSSMFVKGLIRSIVDVFNGVGARRYTGLIRDLVDANWGPPKDGMYPKLALEPQRADLKPQDLAEALTKGKAAGVFTATLDDENAFRAKTGMPPIDAATRDAEKEKAKAALPPAFGGDPTETDKPKPNPFAKAMRAGVTVAFVPSRPLRDSEKNLNLTAMAATFDRAPEDFSDVVRPLAAAALMKALPQLKKLMADGDATDVGDITIDMSAIDVAVKKFMRGLYTDGRNQVAAERRKSIARRHTGAAEEEDDKNPSGEPDTFDTHDVLEPVRKHLVRKMKNRLTSDLEKEAIDVVRTGGDPEDAIVRTIGFQTSSGAFRQDASLVTAKAFSMGREDFAQQHGDEIESVELSAVLDKDTCGACEQLDGSEYEFNSDEHLEHVPPMSSICDGGDRDRCVLAYNFKKPDDAGGSDE